jgi:UDP-galactopyranose mutase
MKQNVIIEKSSELRFKKRPREPYHLTNDAIQTRSYICTGHVDKYDMEYGNLWYQSVQPSKKYMRTMKRSA